MLLKISIFYCIFKLYVSLNLPFYPLKQLLNFKNIAYLLQRQNSRQKFVLFGTRQSLIFWGHASQVFLQWELEVKLRVFSTDFFNTKNTPFSLFVFIHCFSISHYHNVLNLHLFKPTDYRCHLFYVTYSEPTSSLTESLQDTCLK